MTKEQWGTFISVTKGMIKKEEDHLKYLKNKQHISNDVPYYTLLEDAIHRSEQYLSHYELRLFQYETEFNN